MNSDPEAILQVKARAKEMMLELRKQGLTDIRHGHCLQQLAQQAGYKNWQTYSGVLRKAANLDPSKRRAQQGGRL